MKIVIRADASLQIGTGHVMRCLTLAEALKNQGAEIEFICRAHEGHLLERIAQQGFKTHALLNSKIIAGSEPKVEVRKLQGREKIYGVKWLGSTQQEDAVQCKPILNATKPDWLIIDHYAIDQRWHSWLKGTYKKLMVIDDLADRKHQCELLLDQTYGRQAKEYTELVPEKCQMLLGSKYALLRPEFAQWRGYSLQRRAKPEFKKLLITMGGVDPDNVTGQILKALKRCSIPQEVEITAVLGATAPHLESVKRQAETMPYKTQVKANVSNMAEIMANSDVAIGAAGATTWERCCLGLPSLQIVLADNQKTIAQNLQAQNVVKVLENPTQLCKELSSLAMSLLAFSKKSSSILTGTGAQLVSKALYA